MTSPSAPTQVAFPPKLAPLFQPMRYKILHGGRGGAKSWGVARALLIMGAQRRLRILCTREVQKSIRDSVHKLLSDQIEMLGLSSFYVIQQATIFGRNGTEFIFAGLSDQTQESIKSYEGVDIVWCEEARSVSERSFRILLPTIRKEGSEVWCTFNPELESDAVWQRFIVNRPNDAVIIEMSHSDNPWFSDVLRNERLNDKLRMTPEEYAHVWEGKCLPAVHGAIYAAEVAAAQSSGRITEVPYDPLLKAHVVFDLGWNDAMAISIVQCVASSIRVIRYIEDSHRTLADYSSDLRDLKLNWGTVFLPHDARAKSIQTRQSAAEMMTALGWNIEIVPSMSVENGIRSARAVFPRVYFDKSRSARLVECLKRYRRSINTTTNEPGAPLHDEFSHGADCFRYLAIASERMGNDDWDRDFAQPRYALA